jgi:hypothetical protein
LFSIERKSGRLQIAKPMSLNTHNLPSNNYITPPKKRQEVPSITNENNLESQPVFQVIGTRTDLPRVSPLHQLSWKHHSPSQTTITDSGVTVSPVQQQSQILLSSYDSHNTVASSGINVLSIQPTQGQSGNQHTSQLQDISPSYSSFGSKFKQGTSNIVSLEQTSSCSKNATSLVSQSLSLDTPVCTCSDGYNVPTNPVTPNSDSTVEVIEERSSPALSTCGITGTSNQRADYVDRTLSHLDHSVHEQCSIMQDTGSTNMIEMLSRSPKRKG